jgi:hypothetical protein
MTICHVGLNKETLSFQYFSIEKHAFLFQEIKENIPFPLEQMKK